MRVTLLGQGAVLDTIESECRARGWSIALRTDQPTTPTNVGQGEVGFASRYRHKLSPEHLSACPLLNCHPSYLPWNKGAYPNVWPILDGSPAGVTVHWMDAGIDTGPILVQERVEVLPTDTAETLYHRLESEMMRTVRRLFLTYDRLGYWPPSTPQDPKTGNRHYARELERLDLPSADTIRGMGFPLAAEDLFASLRARSFSGYPGLRIGSVRATITLTPVDDADTRA